MKDWKDCDKIIYRKKTLMYEGKPYEMNCPIFRAYYKCAINECRGKILIKAQGRALKAISNV